jgi:hypothetical protein
LLILADVHSIAGLVVAWTVLGVAVFSSPDFSKG